MSAARSFTTDSKADTAHQDNRQRVDVMDCQHKANQQTCQGVEGWLGERQCPVRGGCDPRVHEDGTAPPNGSCLTPATRHLQTDRKRPKYTDCGHGEGDSDNDCGRATVLLADGNANANRGHERKGQ